MWEMSGPYGQDAALRSDATSAEGPVVRENGLAQESRTVFWPREAGSRPLFAGREMGKSVRQFLQG